MPGFSRSPSNTRFAAFKEPGGRVPRALIPPLALRLPGASPRLWGSSWASKSCQHCRAFTARAFTQRQPPGTTPAAATPKGLGHRPACHGPGAALPSHPLPQFGRSAAPACDVGTRNATITSTFYRGHCFFLADQQPGKDHRYLAVLKIHIYYST